MDKNYVIDNLDKNILRTLTNNARVPYTELASRFKVSPATIHVRIEKMKQAGIITRTVIELDPKRLGYDVCCFIGINLRSAKDYSPALKQLEQIEEVLSYKGG